MFERITEAEINERSMANVSTTPGRRTAFGEGGLDAKALKLRFDRLGRYLAKRLNEVFDGIADGSLAEVLYIDSEGKKQSLKDFVDSLLTGQVESIKIQTSDGVITLTELGDRTQEMYNGLDTGDLAGKIKIIEGVTLKKFYEDFLKLEDNIAPVKSVNGKTGEVKLGAEDVGARPDTWMPTAQQVGADLSGSAATAVSGHNTNTASHNDIRLELKRLAVIIADLLDSDDATLDEMHEIVAYIKSNKALIDAITTSKVNVADIINNLDTNISDKPLSAAQGVALKALIDEKGNGSSTESMLGEWEFKDELEILPTDIGVEIPLKFNSKGVSFTSIAKVSLGPPCYGLKYNNPSTGASPTVHNFKQDSMYGFTPGWRDEAYKTIEITEEPTDEVIKAWIKAEAKRKQPVGVDKVTSVDTTWYGIDNLFEEGYGINWDDGIAFLKNEDVISTAAIHQRVPISAGENVTFSYDGESDTIKINATGGGSGGGTTVKYSEGLEYEDYEQGYAVIGIGTCTDEDVLIPPEYDGKPVYYIEEEAFESDGIMKSLYIPKTVTEIPGSIFASNGYAVVNIYCEAKSKPDGWSEDWNFYTNNNNLVEWGYVLGGGAGGSNSGGSLQMPQIRFANFTEYKNEEDMTMYRFTVENLGGGTLQAGDKLQICCRRKYPGGKKKLRKMAEYEITEEDINQRFLKIEVNPNVRGGGAEKWLFRNDRKEGDTLSAMYFRLKRVTKYSDSDGRECDAIFSNVETVWKTFQINKGENGKNYILKIK